MITIQIQAASKAPSIDSSGVLISTASGIRISPITVPVTPSPISQICRLATSRKPKTKVRVNRILGSSPSKPIPAAIERIA